MTFKSYINRKWTTLAVFLLPPSILFIFFILTAICSISPVTGIIGIQGLEDTLKNVKPETLIDVASYEIPYLKNTLPKNYERFNTVLWSFARLTNVDIKDPRSFLGNELPGYSLFYTKIFVAGKGVDYNHLPTDAAPPKTLISKPAHEPAKSHQQPPKKQNQPSPATKTVLIYHTHSWESYLPALKNATQPNQAVSADPSLDVIQVGTTIENQLDSQGIGTMHDMTNKVTLLHNRGWNYNEAYQESRIIMKQSIQKDANLKYFVDVHRDSSTRQYTTATINGTTYGRISFIIGLDDPHYKDNLAFAKKINDFINQHYPGLSRGIIGKNHSEGDGVYNQDLSKHAILIEVGGVDNTLVEVDRTATIFANAFASVYHQVQK